MSGLITSVIINGAILERLDRKVPDHVPWTAACCDVPSVTLAPRSGPAPTIEVSRSISRTPSVNFVLVIVFLGLHHKIIHLEVALVEAYKVRHCRNTGFVQKKQHVVSWRSNIAVGRRRHDQSHKKVCSDGHFHQALVHVERVSYGTVAHQHHRGNIGSI